MYSYIKGCVADKIITPQGDAIILLENAGIGYNIYTTPDTLKGLSKDPSKLVTIYTSLLHREERIELYGFVDKHTRDLFNILITVSGVGIKAAFKILSELSPLDLVSAVIRENEKTLQKVKGVGPKLAKKLILELKDKLIKWHETTDLPATSPDQQKGTQAYIEAEAVLLSLGYENQEVSQALDEATTLSEDTNNSEELLTGALKWLSIK